MYLHFLLDFVTFQMYGEKVEETDELRMDLQDVKEMYKNQVGFFHRIILEIRCRVNVGRYILTNIHFTLSQIEQLLKK